MPWHLPSAAPKPWTHILLLLGRHVLHLAEGGPPRPNVALLSPSVLKDRHPSLQKPTSPLKFNPDAFGESLMFNGTHFSQHSSGVSGPPPGLEGQYDMRSQSIPVGQQMVSSAGMEPFTSSAAFLSQDHASVVRPASPPPNWCTAWISAIDRRCHVVQVVVVIHMPEELGHSLVCFDPGMQAPSAGGTRCD